jgi:single-stranded-DNA-specific exonuclease
VDNGTSSAETIGALKRIGIDTVVTDHHEPPAGELPEAVAIVNPKLAGSTYPFRELCGSAVAFKLAWGLARRIGGEERVPARLRDFLVDAMSLVAIATVCDVVPLVSENRILARFGLKALERSPTVGLRALLQVTGLHGRPLTAEDVGFQIGPRINAAGRLGSADLALDLLLAEEPARAGELARRLDAINQERKDIEREISALAFRQAERFADAERWPVLVLADEGWHSGVIGIVASRLTEAYARPALVIALENGLGRGSARSVDGFSVLDAMHGGAQHMSRYGGHEQAAGCEVRADSVEALREAVCQRAREMLRSNDGSSQGQREEVIDCELALGDMTRERMQSLSGLEPFGSANSEPVLLSRDVRLAEPARVIGGNGDHLLLQVRRGETVMKALGFGMGRRSAELGMGVPIDIVYTPRWNTFRGETSLELRLRDFRVGQVVGC